MATWALTRQAPPTRRDALAGLVSAVVVLVVALNRYLPSSLCCNHPLAPAPDRTGAAGPGRAVAAGLSAHPPFSRRCVRPEPDRGRTLLALLVVLKSPTLAEYTSALLRRLNGQDPGLASTLDIRWLGYSYIAFRLLHTVLDRRSGRMPQVSLDEYLTYTLFFPTLTAGPIDRLPRFLDDLQAGHKIDGERLLTAGKRLVTGVFMKFVLADGLAVFALNQTNAVQTHSTPWMWLLTYAYAFRIFFDFAGYTSIAIGIGHLFGFTLPENFRQPYRQPNLTVFWNCWHMTLAQWFRAYFFNPLTRGLRQRKWPVALILVLGQFGTMALIGLWHGLTWNFLIWGLWHGLGLFVHNRWAEYRKGKEAIQRQLVGGKTAGLLLTFHYVLLGWVWFALPTPALALHVFGILFGGGA